MDAFDYDSINLWWCEDGAKAFDDYCHGITNPKKYADYRDPDSLQCEYEGDIPAQTHCLAQSCMYDYCIWRRDEYVNICNNFNTYWNEATEGVGCEEEGWNSCKITSVPVTMKAREGTQCQEFTSQKDARMTLTSRPSWGNVYDYDVMHGEYKNLMEANSDASFLEECEIFYDYMSEVLDDDY